MLFFAAVARYERAAAQARELLAALRHNEIRVIPLKGIWLAGSLYDDGACRPMVDIDLLVAPSDLTRAIAVVERLGYTTDDFPLEETGGKHLHFRKEGVPLPLELHWRLWSRRDDDAADERDAKCVWSELSESELFGTPVAVFSVERKLIYLAHHILGHDWAVPLRAYLDLALLCQRFGERINIRRLEREAHSWRIAFGARFMLQVAADLLGAQAFEALPPFMSERALSAKARRAASVAAVQLTRGSIQITPALARSLRKSRSRRLSDGFKRVWLHPAELRIIYPQVVRRWGLCGGYLWRAFDLLRRHGAAMFVRRPAAEEAEADQANFNLRQTLSHWVSAREQE